MLVQRGGLNQRYDGSDVSYLRRAGVDRGSSDDWRALMSRSVSLPGGLGWMTANTRPALEETASLPSGPATTQLRPGQVSTSAAVEVLLRVLGKVAAEKPCSIHVLRYYLVRGRSY